MKHIQLQLKGTSEDVDPVSATGSGPTLIAALASLEASLIALLGPEAAFQESCCFSRDFESFFEDLGEIGGTFRCFDFSTPEDAFEITRLPDGDPETSTTSADDYGLEEHREALLELTQDQHCSDLIQIYPDARFSPGVDNGCYVEAWLWCDFSDTPFDKDLIAPSDANTLPNLNP